MSNCQHRRWIGFVALALPLYLAGCATATPPAFSTAEGGGNLADAPGTQRYGVRFVAKLPLTATDFPTATPGVANQDRSSPPSQALASTATGDAGLSLSEPAVSQDGARSEASLPPQPNSSAINQARWHTIPLPTPSNSQSASRPIAKEAAAPKTNDTSATTAAAAPPIPMMEVESGPGSPIYHVQLAAYRRADQAEAGWQRLTAAAATLLGDLAPLIRRVDLGPDKGVFFRLQTGLFTEPGDAARLCRSLLARGIDCMIVKARQPEMPRESATQRRYAADRATAPRS